MKKRIGILLVGLMLLLCFACGAKESGEAVPQPAAEPIYEGVHLVVYGEEAGEPVGIHTDLQAEFLHVPYEKPHRKAQGTDEQSFPEPLVLDFGEWAKANAAGEYIVTLKSDDGLDARSYTTKETTLAVSNLLVNAAYTWTVNAGAPSSFRTADVKVRNLHVDGITNVRDLGGYRTNDGKVTKQGLIFRCGRLNQSRAKSPIVEITEEGARVMLDELHIVSEIDLRRTDNNEVGAITASVLGDSVRYYCIPMQVGLNDDTDALLTNADALKELFSILADASNYPLCFHCDIGTDRTGLVAILIHGLCGVDEKDICYDYVFSNLGKIKSIRTYEKFSAMPYVQHLRNAEGATFREKVRSSLLAIGIPEADMDAVAAIMTE